MTLAFNVPVSGFWPLETLSTGDATGGLRTAFLTNYAVEKR